MKKYYLIVIISILSMNSFSQIYFNENHIPQEVMNNLNRMGLDTNEYFNDYEMEYFSNLFNNANINLKGKRIAFIKFCGRKSNKKEYFNEVKEFYYRNKGIVSTELYILNETQKKKSGGYDIIFVYWCKRTQKIEKLIKVL